MRPRSLLRPARVGLKVADPVAHDFLPAEGREVVMTHYWQRRLVDGDVVVVGGEGSERKKPKQDARRSADRQEQ